MKTISILFQTILVLIILAIAGGFGFLYTSLPTINGEIAVDGLQDEVQVIRSRRGIPIIKAKTAEDAYFALGFTHAQDRLWQMDIQRRIGAGRLSEIVGEATVDADKFMRTIGIYEKAKMDYERIEIKQAFESYADGVNAYIQTHEGALSPEFYILNYKPDPWHPVDSVVWGRMMGLQLSSNFFGELKRLALSKTLTPEQIADLFQPYPKDAPVSISFSTEEKIEETPETPDNKETEGLPPKKEETANKLMDLVSSMFPAPGASNAWVIGPEKTINGKTLLAADPHLSFSLPNMWYLARLEAPGLTVSGATVPGVPFVIMGHNNHVGWGFTTSYVDTQDLFLEQVNPNNKNQYFVPDGFEDFKTRNELIPVKGGEPVRFTVRETRHGPVISDIFEETREHINDNEVIAFRATTLLEENRTAEALQTMNWANQSIIDFIESLRLFDTPTQNITFADVKGNIGMISIGKIPIRENSDGFNIQEGWTKENAWTGFIPFEDLPRSLNPDSSILINANNKIIDDAYPFFLSQDYQPPYRMQRIKTLLDTPRKWSSIDMNILQTDVSSLMALDLLSLMLPEIEKGQLNPTELMSYTMLEEWLGNMNHENPQPLIFMTWLKEFSDALYADELGELYEKEKRFRPLFYKHALQNKPEWCDNILTENKETCRDILKTSFVFAIKQLYEKYGNNAREWRWGDEHKATLNHMIYSRIPVLNKFLNVSAPSSGGPQTVNRADIDLSNEQAPFNNVHGAGFRMILDFESLDDSAYVINGGQSGNLMSTHYRNFMTPWLSETYIRINENAGNFVELLQGVLTLTPR